MPSLTSRALLTFGRSWGPDPPFVLPHQRSLGSRFPPTKTPSAFSHFQGNTPVSDRKGTGKAREKYFGKTPKVMWRRERKKRGSPGSSQGKTFLLQQLRYSEKINESNENAKQAESL